MKGLITPVNEESIITKTTRLLLEDSANTMREYIEENYNIEFTIGKQNDQLIIIPKFVKKNNLEA